MQIIYNQQEAEEWFLNNVYGTIGIINSEGRRKDFDFQQKEEAIQFIQS